MNCGMRSEQRINIMEDTTLTIKQISDLAGVSVATVSRVINQKGKYSKETEKKILRIIEENNYSPNAIARSLRKNQTRVVGIIVPDITNEFFAKLTLSAQNHLLRYQYMAIICNTNENQHLERMHLDMLKSQRISGLIIAGQNLHTNLSPTFPVVFVDRPIYEKEASSEDGKKYILIESDNRNGGYLAAKELISKKCKNPAMVCFTKRTHKTECARYLGFCDALEEHGMDSSHAVVQFVEDGTTGTGNVATCEILAKDPTVDGIFYSNDLLAVGGMNALESIGKKVPDDIKVVGFDNISLSQVTIPSLTTCSQNIDELSKEAVDCLYKLMNSLPVVQPEKVAVSLVVRDSSAAKSGDR